MDKSHPYNRLAEFYDQIMAEIDYEYWADYLDGIIQEYHPEATNIFEWACGTGSLAFSLNELECYDITACDLSAEMIHQAQLKLPHAARSDLLHFFAHDMKETLAASYHNSADVGICVFDSLNYLIEEKHVQAFFKHASSVIKPKGFLLFDFVTQAHCLENAHDFSYEESFYEGMRVIREAHYPIEGGLHQTSFRLYEGQDTDKLLDKEIHLQRPYSFQQIKAILSNHSFEFIAAFGDFTDQAPKKNAKRITLLAQCQKT